MSSHKRRKIAKAVTEKDESLVSSLVVKLGSVRRGSASLENEVFSAFSRLQSKRKTCDFVIKFGKEEIHVHRAVLAASSRYYERIFTEDKDEKREGFVDFDDDITPETGKQCIDYIYTGKVQASCKSPENLLYAAELMELPSLTDMYLEFLKEELGMEKCLKYTKLAETYNHRSFAKFFKRFSADEFSDIITSDNFTSMSKPLFENFLEAVSARGRDMETLKWEAIMKWVKADTKERKCDFSKLFNLINFENLREEFIRESVSKEHLVTESTQCLEKAFDALCAINHGVVKNSPTHLIICHSDSRFLLKYNVKTKNWSRLAQVPDEMITKLDQTMDIVCVKSEVYIGTGNSLIKFSGSKWEKIQITEGESIYSRCVAHEKFVYMVTQFSVTEFNTDMGTWTEYKEELGFSNHFAIAASNTHLYAIGGGDYQKLAKEFDFQTKTWENITRMSARLAEERVGCAALFHREKLFALGGKNGRKWKSGAEAYDPRTDTWMYMGTNLENTNFKAFVVEDKIYIVGGEKCTEKITMMDSGFTK